MTKLSKNLFNSADSKDIVKHYHTLCIAMQSLFTDVHISSDKINTLESELKDIKNLLIQILKYQKELSQFESKVFRDNLSK